MHIGNTNTESVDISGSGYGTAMGVYLAGETDRNGPAVEINGKNVYISAHSIDGYSHGIYVGNNTTELNGKTAASLKINAENLTINATSDVEGGYPRGSLPTLKEKLKSMEMFPLRLTR